MNKLKEMGQVFQSLGFEVFEIEEGKMSRVRMELSPRDEMYFINDLIAYLYHQLERENLTLWGDVCCKYTPSGDLNCFIEYIADPEDVEEDVRTLKQLIKVPDDLEFFEELEEITYIIPEPEVFRAKNMER